jgi:hypothetical protein
MVLKNMDTFHSIEDEKPLKQNPVGKRKMENPRP